MELVPLSQAPPKAVAKVRAVYEEAFPQEEQLPFNTLMAPPPEVDRQVTVLLNRGEAGAFCCTLELAGFPALLLEYLAVERHRRGQDLGGTLWRHVQSVAGSRPGVEGVVLEVEDPGEPGIDPAEAGARNRRMRFYTARGATPLPVSGYRIPNQCEGPALPMRLMWAPTACGGMPEPDALRRLLLTLHTEGYGLPADNDLTRIALIHG